jgi:hypothetical protein
MFIDKLPSFCPFQNIEVQDGHINNIIMYFVSVWKAFFGPPPPPKQTDMSLKVTIQGSSCTWRQVIWMIIYT